MEVDVGEVNLRGGRAGIHRVMDRHAGVHGGRWMGVQVIRKVVDGWVVR